MTTPQDSSNAAFRISIRFADTVVAGIAGELDLCTGPDLAAVLGALVSRGHQTITVECEELDFIDASGLRALVATQAALSASNGELHVRELSPFAYRVFEITGLIDVLHAQRRITNEQADLPGTDDTDRRAQRAAFLVGEAARLDVVSDLLALAPRFIGACDGASVTWRRGTNLITPAASDETVRYLDGVQYDGNGGPCVQATDTGLQVYGPTLDDEHRWAEFTTQALARGVHSVLSTPLIIGDQPTGALNLYSRTAAAFLPADQDVASVLAGVIATLFDQPEASSDPLERWISEAIDSRDTIAHAQGILMERHGFTAEIAYGAVRQDSVTTSTPLRELARQIILETRNRAHPPNGEGPSDV